MKKLLLFSLFLICGLASGQELTIEGDTMLCPNTDGTAQVANSTVYEAYQWYKKGYYSDTFEAIPGATQASFTYDWYYYDLSEIKLETKLNGVHYESNTLFIATHMWIPMYLTYEPSKDVYYDGSKGTYYLCAGSSFVLKINSPPFTANIQWFRNGQPILGANSPSYAITQSGTYTVQAAPTMCPDHIEAPGVGINVTLIKCGRNPGIEPKSTASKIDINTVNIYPNPSTNHLNVNLPEDSGLEEYTITDLTGKTLLNGTLSQTNNISTTELTAGTYIIKIAGNGNYISKLFIKK